jgi:hypothetical protein
VLIFILLKNRKTQTSTSDFDLENGSGDASELSNLTFVIHFNLTNKTRRDAACRLWKSALSYLNPKDAEDTFTRLSKHCHPESLALMILKETYQKEEDKDQKREIQSIFVPNLYHKNILTVLPEISKHHYLAAIEHHN